MDEEEAGRSTKALEGNSEKQEQTPDSPGGNEVRKPRSIILLSDGTGNSAAKLNRTNVWRLYQALDLDTDRQIAFYDDGVGTSGSKIWAAFSGAFGFGLSRNVRQLYQFLCEHYRPNDRIYIFGFSRGAFTARMLAGLITQCGILDPKKAIHPSSLSKSNDKTKLVGLNTQEGRKAGVARAYRSYRRGYNAWIADGFRWIQDLLFRPTPSPDDFRKNYCLCGSRRIAGIGVWDTVDAVGLPVDELSALIDKGIFPIRFENQDLSVFVDRARHAIAIDDERHSFHPTLWSEEIFDTEDKDDRAYQEPKKKCIGSGDDRLLQVWFAGMHSDVGGGYPDNDLAFVSLQWMVDQFIDRTSRSGLLFNAENLREIEQRANPLGKMHDSRSGFAVYYRYKPRNVYNLCNDSENSINISKPKVHESVIKRIAEATDGYAPVALTSPFEVYPTPQSGKTGLQPIPEEDAERRRHLNRAQDHVLWRRVLYFLMIGVTLFLVAAPLLYPPVPGLELTGLQSFVGEVLGLVSSVLPAFLDPWLDAWSQAPIYFLVCLGIWGTLIWQGRRASENTQRLTETAWHVVRKQGASDPTEPRKMLFEGIAAMLRASGVAKCLYRFASKVAAPITFAVLSVFLLVSVGLRLLVFDASPPTVEEGGKTGERRGDLIAKANANFGKAFAFNTQQPYLDTGLALNAGEEYTITLASNSEAEQAPWRDGDFQADHTGLAHPMARFHPAFLVNLPFRRHLRYPWFSLVGEIGFDTGHTLPIRESELTFRPKHSGRLYLYVNDAINNIDPVLKFLKMKFGWGILNCETRQKAEDLCEDQKGENFGWDAYYKNNFGKVAITVSNARSAHSSPEGQPPEKQ